MSLNSITAPARVSLLALVLALAAPGSASADPAAARACASTLSAEGRMMFEAAAAKVKPLAKQAAAQVLQPAGMPASAAADAARG